MSFENPSFSTETKEKDSKKGMALKSFIAITNGLLNRSAKSDKENGFIISAVDRAKETYKSLEQLEKQIDPSGNLSGEIEERITSGFGKLADWLTRPRTQETTKE
jgi:hypothetical protein